MADTTPPQPLQPAHLSRSAAEAPLPTALGPGTSSGGAQAVMRRIILFVILFALIAIAAAGISGLLERAIDTGRVLIDDTGGLARSIAFTLIGAPLAGVLWWYQRRHLVGDAGERASLMWSLYLAAMTVTALITALAALGNAAAAGLDGQWRPGELATGVVWAGVWLWHRQLRRNAAIAPTRLATLAVQLSALIGLLVGASGAISVLASLLSAAITDAAPLLLLSSQQWFITVLQGLVWLVLGGVVWCWQWFGERARDAAGAFASVLLVIIVGGAAATALFAFGTTLYVLLRVLFDTDPLAEVLEPLDTAIAATLIGALIWAYLSGVLATRSADVRRAGRLVIAGIALIGAASGFGVTVNALLASLSPALVGSDARTLLLGGISALVVGAPVWWIAWRPAHTVSATDAAAAARRVYLVIVFGASAVVAIVTLLLIGYRVFDVLLGGGASSLIEQIRAPLGLLAATTLVFAYHFAIWRRDRALVPRAEVAAARPAIGEVILVTDADATELVARIREVTGARVTVWLAAGSASPGAALDLDAALRSLDGTVAPRVLMISMGNEAPRMLPLAE